MAQFISLYICIHIHSHIPLRTHIYIPSIHTTGVGQGFASHVREFRVLPQRGPLRAAGMYANQLVAFNRPGMASVVLEHLDGIRVEVLGKTLVAFNRPATVLEELD